jgi:hypothetical protein
MDSEIHTEELTVEADDVFPVSPAVRIITYHREMGWELQSSSLTPVQATVGNICYLPIGQPVVAGGPESD